MKITSVVLALSAVAAMVQAVPLSKRDAGDVQGDDGVFIGLISIGHTPINIDLRKRDAGDVQGDIEAGTGLINIGHLPIHLRKRFVDSILERVPISGISKRDLAQSIPTDVSAIHSLINGLVDPIHVTLATLVQIAVDAHFHLSLGIANIVEANVDIQVAIKTAIDVAITENLTSLDDTINSLVNNAVTTAETVNVDALATQAIDLIHDRVAEIVVQVNASVLADIYAKIMALGLVEIKVAVDLDAELGLNVDICVGRLLGDLSTIKQRLVENLVQ